MSEPELEVLMKLSTVIICDANTKLNVWLHKMDKMYKNKKFQDLLNMIEPNNRPGQKGTKRSWAMNCCTLIIIIEDFLKHLWDFRKFRPMKWISTEKRKFLLLLNNTNAQNHEFQLQNGLILSFDLISLASHVNIARFISLFYLSFEFFYFYTSESKLNSVQQQFFFALGFLVLRMQCNEWHIPFFMGKLYDQHNNRINGIADKVWIPLYTLYDSILTGCFICFFSVPPKSTRLE